MPVSLTQAPLPLAGEGRFVKSRRDFHVNKIPPGKACRTSQAREDTAAACGQPGRTFSAAANR
jgi:hypothetical protein